ncbi:hypothetical protein [Streptomyces sp. NPDC093223]|uniref:hypothetical protein n=1 Tax=Streptomyces sp. NPDC093223 TaxID=3366033 RepID=UPI0037F892D9
MKNIKTRYHYGRADDRGRIPVFVDDAAEPAGHVWKMGRSACRWWALGAGDPDHCGTNHFRKYQAAERLVGMVDVRNSVAAEAERRRARRTQAPAGWRFATWEEIERDGYRQVRPVRSALLVALDGTELYPNAFTDYPVTLKWVTRLHNGCVVVTGIERGAIGAHYNLLMNAAHAALGALIPEKSARHIAPGECPACEQDAQLYQVDTRLGCADCTATDLGVSVDHLPAPAKDDGAVWWRVGDTARRTFALPDDHGHAETGRVIETSTDITDRMRRVRVDYGGSWPISADAARLAPAA